MLNPIYNRMFLLILALYTAKGNILEKSTLNIRLIKLIKVNKTEIKNSITLVLVKTVIFLNDI
jgi:hypothetical protein